jgi:DNA-binding response OmpR family regulator
MEEMSRLWRAGAEDFHANPNLETNAELKKITHAQKQRALQLDGKEFDLTDLFVTEEGKRDSVLRICDRVTARQASRK